MRSIRLLLVSGLTLYGVVPLASAQNVTINAAITGEIAPGVYGQVVLGNAPPPPLVYAQPMIAAPVAVAPAVAVEPIYLHVPPGHAKHWRKHCHEYHACDRPVYFVRSAEYEPGFDMERWRAEHGHGNHGEHEHGHHGDRGHEDQGDHDRGRHDD